MAPVGGTSVATIESLRARLLAERAASKEAREHAHNIALKVFELQSRLDAEVEQRKKAEVAMQEVLELLRAKGVVMEGVMMSITSISVSSESEEAVQLSSSKECESEHSCGEDASHIHSTSYQQDNVSEAQHMEALSCQSEGVVEDKVSDNTKIMPEEASNSDPLDSEKILVPEDRCTSKSDESDEEQGVNENEEQIKHEQNVLTDALDKHPDTSQSESMIMQPPELLYDSSQDHFTGPIPSSARFGSNVHSGSSSLSEYLQKPASSLQAIESNLEITVDLPSDQSSVLDKTLSLHARIGGAEKAKGSLLQETAAAVTLFPSGPGDGDIYGAGMPHTVGDKPVRELPPRDMIPPVRENTLGGPNHLHSAVPNRGRHPFEQVYTNLDPLHNAPYWPTADASVAFSRGPIYPAYIGEYARYPSVVSMSDAIHSLVDDKSGKLGDILMALNMAKQQINDETCTTAYMEEPYEAAASRGPFIGKPYLGLYDGGQHPPHNCRRRLEPQSQAPIVHLPISPRSDYEPSPFEAHNGIGSNSNSTYAYYMPGYDTYLQPTGELHLGNGITLYTDQY